MQFKVGDIVRGTCEPDEPYGVTHKDFVGKVTDVDVNRFGVIHIRINHIWWVKPEYFVLEKPAKVKNGFKDSPNV